MFKGVPKSGFLEHSRAPKPESLWLVLPSQGKCLGLASSLGPPSQRTAGLSGKFCRQAGLGLQEGEGLFVLWEACVVPWV